MKKLDEIAFLYANMFLLIYFISPTFFPQGYKYAMNSEEMKSLVPAGLEGKADILFGNLEELYRFHGEVFLQDLENCISTTDLVALCFTHRVCFIVLLV